MSRPRSVGVVPRPAPSAVPSPATGAAAAKPTPTVTATAPLSPTNAAAGTGTATDSNVVYTPYGRATLLETGGTDPLAGDANGLVSVKFVDWDATARLSAASAISKDPTKFASTTPTAPAAGLSPTAAATGTGGGGGATPSAAVRGLQPSQSGEWDVSENMLLQSGLRLYVHIVRARNIMAADMAGLSNAYCVLRVGGLPPPNSSAARSAAQNPDRDEQRTSTIVKTVNPEWNESFAFNVAADCHYLVIDLYDEVKLVDPKQRQKSANTVDTSGDRPLGQVLVPLSHLSVSSVVGWYPVGRSERQSRSTGELNLELMLTRPIDHALDIDCELAAYSERVSTLQYEKIACQINHKYYEAARAAAAAEAAEDKKAADADGKSKASAEAKAADASKSDADQKQTKTEKKLLLPKPAVDPNDGLIRVSYPDPQTEKVEWKSDYDVRMAYTATHHAKGRLYLSNYRLIFLSDLAEKQFGGDVKQAVQTAAAARPAALKKKQMADAAAAAKLGPAAIAARNATPPAAGVRATVVATNKTPAPTSSGTKPVRFVQSAVMFCSLNLSRSLWVFGVYVFRCV